MCAQLFGCAQTAGIGIHEGDFLVRHRHAHTGRDLRQQGGFARTRWAQCHNHTRTFSKIRCLFMHQALCQKTGEPLIGMLLVDRTGLSQIDRDQSRRCTRGFQATHHHLRMQQGFNFIHRLFQRLQTVGIRIRQMRDAAGWCCRSLA